MCCVVWCWQRDDDDDDEEEEDRFCASAVILGTGGFGLVAKVRVLSVLRVLRV